MVPLGEALQLPPQFTIRSWPKHLGRRREVEASVRGVVDMCCVIKGGGVKV